MPDRVVFLHLVQFYSPHLKMLCEDKVSIIVAVDKLFNLAVSSIQYLESK